nr:hypothetical protein 30 [Balneolaceae bacterium]
MIPTDDRERAEFFYDQAHLLVLNWYVGEKVKPPMPPITDPLANLIGMIQAKLEENYQKA